VSAGGWGPVSSRPLSSAASAASAHHLSAVVPANGGIQPSTGERLASVLGITDAGHDSPRPRGAARPDARTTRAEGWIPAFVLCPL